MRFFALLGITVLWTISVSEIEAQDISEKVQFFLYTKKNTLLSQELKINDAKSVKESNFDSSKPTFFIIHGYINNLLFPAIQDPKNALLKEYDGNVIAVDWGKIAFTLNYAEAAAETPNVGKHVADMIKFLSSTAGLDPKKTQLIGHSLGAHVSGFAGKNLKGLGLARITGLDPAGPGFFLSSAARRLDKSDAEFVDCIFTCAGKLGHNKAICQSNFFPNGGSGQPGCTFDTTGTCSHMRVIDLYVESVNPKNKFTVSACKAIPNDKGKGCTKSTVVMGQHTSTSEEGMFFVKTKSKSPFAA